MKRAGRTATRSPDGRATMQDVAAEAGVSVSTVSKVLNGRYGVASATSALVNEVIERLGYEASLVAQSLRNSRTNVIGVLVSDFEPFSVEVLKGAADAIRGTGYELIAYSAGGQVDEHVGWERRYLSRVMGTLVDGAVLVTPTVTDVQYDGPVVAVDPHTGRSRLPTLSADNLQGEMRTLPLGVADYSTEYSADTAGVLAFTTVAIIPALVLFLTMQGRIVNVLVGAVKCGARPSGSPVARGRD